MFRTTSKKIALIAGAVVVLVAIISLYAKCKPMEESAQPITLLFFTPDGKMIMRQIGYVDAKHLIKFGEEALTRK